MALALAIGPVGLAIGAVFGALGAIFGLTSLLIEKGEKGIALLGTIVGIVELALCIALL